MPKKKTAKKHASPAKPMDTKAYADKIEKFLKKAKRPYSEPNLLAELFGIKRGTDFPLSEKQLKELSGIRDALKLLQQEKKVIAVLLEDPKTKEDELHYSASGWYATP